MAGFKSPTRISPLHTADPWQEWPWLVSVLSNGVPRAGLTSTPVLIPTYPGPWRNALLYAELRKTFEGLSFERRRNVQVNEINFLSRSDMETWESIGTSAPPQPTNLMNQLPTTSFSPY